MITEAAAVKKRKKLADLESNGKGQTREANEIRNELARLAKKNGDKKKKK